MTQLTALLRRLAELVSGRFPEASRGAVALYRWGLGILTCFAMAGEFEALAPQIPSAYSHDMAHFGSTYFPPSEWIAGSLPAYRSLEVITLLALLTFAAGLRPRFSALVAGVGLLLLELVNNAMGMSVHSTWVPTLVILGMALVPWDDTLGIRPLLGRKPGPDPAAPAGPGMTFALWMPGFMLGLAYLGAGIAKLNQSGLDWILGGAVKYHWLEDAGRAWTTLGIRISGNDFLSVVSSGWAVAAEIGFIGIIFFRGERMRMLFAAAGLSLHMGLWLFQGLFWTHWWSLYLAFLPWESIYRFLASRLPRLRQGVARAPLRPRLAQLVFVAYFAGQQAVASMMWIEIEPVMSMWGMYSHTFESREDFWEHVRWWKYQRYAFEFEDASGARTDATERVYAVDAAVRESLVRAFAEHERTGVIEDGARREVEEGMRRWQELTGERPVRVTVHMDAQAVDYESGQIYWKDRDVPLGTLDLRTFELSDGRHVGVASGPPESDEP